MKTKQKQKQTQQNRVGKELRRKQMSTKTGEKEMWVSALCVSFFLSSCLSSCQRISHRTTTGPLEGRLQDPHMAWRREKERSMSLTYKLFFMIPIYIIQVYVPSLHFFHIFWHKFEMETQKKHVFYIQNYSIILTIKISAFIMKETQFVLYVCVYFWSLSETHQKDDSQKALQ